MGDNEGEAEITKKGSFGFNNEREQWAIDANMNDVESVRQALSGKSEPGDYVLMERTKTSFFVTKKEIVISTNDPEIKRMIAEQFGAKFDTKVVEKYFDAQTGKEIPKGDPMIEGFRVGRGFTEDQALDAIQGGKAMYRLGLDFNIGRSSVDGNIYIVPIKESSKAAEFKEFLQAHTNPSTGDLNVPQIVAANQKERKKATV